MQTSNLSMSILAFLKMNETPFQAVLVTRTLFKLNKKNKAKTKVNAFGDIYKVQKTVVDLNANYEKAVKQQQAVEGVPVNFEAEKLTWGKHICKAVIEHNGGLYLQTITVGKRGKTVYENSKGEEVNFADIVEFMPAKKASVKQNLEDEVQVRTYAFTSILEVVIKTPEMVIRLVP